MEIIREIKKGKPLINPDDVYKYLEEFKDEDREFFIAIGLDSKNKPCYREIVSIGTLNSGLVHPREVFKKAIMMSCNSIIIAHNHPSGDPTPSDEDMVISNKLKKCGELLCIFLLDSIIIGSDNYYSFQENNWRNKNG
jgi:DNA repair protein RadC